MLVVNAYLLLEGELELGSLVSYALGAKASVLSRLPFRNSGCHLPSDAGGRLLDDIADVKDTPSMLMLRDDRTHP